MEHDSYRSNGANRDHGWEVKEENADRPRAIDSYRRRSPGPHDRRSNARGPRARSRSPVIDQYRPGERYRDDFYGHARENGPRDREERRRGATPPAIDRYVPGQDPQPPPIRVNPLPPPISLDYQVGFNFFAEWWRAEQGVKEDEERAKSGNRRIERPQKGDPREEREKERAQIQIAYDAYKEELQAKVAKSFVQLHKAQEWFKERYIPEVRDPFREKLVSFRREASSRWQNDLSEGVFDLFTLEGIYKTESNGEGGVIEREEGETVAAAEVLGVGDLVPSRGGEIRDEFSHQPALLIKTLAPTVSREKIEDFCKEHLGDGDGGFKWLSLSDPNPQKKCHRIGWIMLHPDSEGELPIDRGDGREEDQEMVDRPEQSENKGSMVTTAEKALEAINGKTIYDETRGDFVCHVGVHIPSKDPRKKALWDLFSAPERIEKDLEFARRITTRFDSEMAEGVDGVELVNQRVEYLRSTGQLQSSLAPTNGAKRKKKVALADDGDDPEDIKVESADEGEESDDEDEGAIDEEEVDSDELLAQKKTLDMLVEYLRRVYNFCLYCVFECDSIHELIRKCPGGHLRRPRASLGTSAKNVAKASALGQPFPIKRRESNAGDNPVTSNTADDKKPGFRGLSKNDQQLQRAFNWVKTYEDKIMQILEPEHVDIKKLGGIPLEEGLTEELRKYVKQEDEAKFRCKVPECTKLFKGENFWRKHVEKRHPEWFGNIEKDIQLVNTYVLDPSHIAPSRTDANSNGHFPMSNQIMNAGTPRGFNLGSMPPLNNFPTFSGAPGFPGFANFGNHSVQMPAGWNNAGVPGGMGEDNGGMHQPGPMRRGGGRFQNRNAGPYDRRQPRHPSNGRLSPPRGMPMNNNMMMMMMGGAAGRPGMKSWGDGMGAQGIGPQEAVQGRSVKSYQDLDAVSGSGGGELNY